MLLTISTTHAPATDLGYLLHKHPDRVQEFTQAFGTATVFYPTASDGECTAALLLDVDQVRLTRGRPRNSPDFSLAQYVNDRSYAASSLLAVALGDVFSTARAGRCRSHQDLAEKAIPLRIEVPVMPCRGGVEVAQRVFAPLGWTVEADPIPLDETFTDWGDSRYLTVRLTGTLRLSDALNQLYVLLPALDEAKHYWQGPDEVDKLIRSGGGWLATHPDRELITRRYLGRRGALVKDALARLAELDDDVETALEADTDEEAEQPEERRVPLNARRHEAVHAALRDLGATSVIDMGCGPGQFLRRLVDDRAFTRVVGCDVSAHALQYAARRLHIDRMNERQAARVSLFQAALTYIDDRFEGFDAAVLMEVIEHVDPSRLDALAQVVFGHASPGAVLVTTPNREYNVLYDNLTGPRHPDHRFEWDRTEFAAWADAVASAYGYTVTISGIGDEDAAVGAPTQLARFVKDGAGA